MKLVPYRVSPINKNYYDWQYGKKWEMAKMGKKALRILKSIIYLILLHLYRNILYKYIIVKKKVCNLYYLKKKNFN